ncbi:MAG: hypothetical protein Q9160_004559 [Pyrenula sp. 1 TL-2023]
MSAASPPSSGSPCPAQPTSLLKIKPSLSASSPPAATSPSTPSSFTSKEWIVPPRPKPGRKPATDTPPTKRKAQNRAAQRAFRERRAARVGELEEQIQQIEDQDHRQIEVLKDSMQRLQRDLQTYMEKCRVLQSMVEFEKGEKEKLAQKLQKLSNTGSTEAVPITRQQPVDAQVNSSSETSPNELAVGNAPIGCGNCSLDSTCQCLEEVINGANAIAGLSQNHATNPPGSSDTIAASSSSIKAEPGDNTELEIDFTTYNGDKPQIIQDDDVDMSSPDASTPINDPCGFCSDGTPCVCAQMAAEDQQSIAQNSNIPSSRATANTASSNESLLTSLTPHPLRQQTSQQFTPPPSDGDVTNPCANGPGTCAQCLSDPASTLFCKSLAASRAQSSANSTCCGKRGDCVRAHGGNAHAPNVPSPLRLSCADTYTTLSRHEGYQQASKDIGSWMPKLAAESTTTDGRHPMEIEAATVMSLLSEFDRRFPAAK